LFEPILATAKETDPQEGLADEVAAGARVAIEEAGS
jgi:hypothetical protein